MRAARFSALTLAGFLISPLACQRSSESPGVEAKPASSSETAEKGRQLFALHCVTCHGPDGGGVKGLGRSLRDSAYIKSSADPELVAMITAGRLATDPRNATGILMPPKGGNPSLTESDLRDVVAFLRTLQ